MNFSIGDKVKWTSQAHGSAKDKAGKVVEIVPPRAQPKSKIGDVGLCGRMHESYVVQVDQDNTHLTPKFYWPRVSALHLQSEPEAEKTVPASLVLEYFRLAGTITAKLGDADQDEHYKAYQAARDALRKAAGL